MPLRNFREFARPEFVSQVKVAEGEQLFAQAVAYVEFAQRYAITKLLKRLA